MSGSARGEGALPYDAETVPCALCGGADHEPIADRGKGGQALRTVICRGCGHVFTNPMPTAAALEAFYGEAYRRDYKGVLEPRPKHVLRSARRGLARLARLGAHAGPGSRVLDVGAGAGEFLYLLGRRGYRARGIEPNRGYAAFARRVLGVDVEVGTIESVELVPGAWDAVTAHHVVEHLRDPVAALARLREALRPGGHLVVEVPNIEARYHSPHTRFHFAHVHGFVPETLERAGERAGLEVVDTRLEGAPRHVNTVFRRPAGGDPARRRDHPSVHARVSEALRAQTPAAHWLTVRPYARLAANLLRPAREALALRGESDPIAILDRSLARSRR